MTNKKEKEIIRDFNLFNIHHDRIDKISFLSEDEKYQRHLALQHFEDNLNKIVLEKQSELNKKKLLKENVVRILQKEVYGLRKSLKTIKFDLRYWKNRSNRFENKSIAIVTLIESSNVENKLKKRARNIQTSPSEIYGKIVLEEK